jgi:hypothetical protein
MPYTATRRFYDAFGKRVSKFITYRRAKRLYNEINRDMAFFESRYMKNRPHHA